MSTNFWYLDHARTQLGPVREDEFVRLIRQGAITRETLIWTAGMSEWRMAGQVPNVSSLFGPPALPSGVDAPASGAAAGGPVAGGHGVGPLNPVIPVWGFFWRSVVTLIGIVLIIPAPWVGPWFYKWLCERVSLPDGRPLTFSGKPGDIWYVFVGWGALMWLGQLQDGRYELLTVGVTWILGMLLLKWFCTHASTADGRLKLSFEGGYLPYIGWNILLALSFVTIIGWAWVMKYMLRWICQNVRGTAEFAFTGTGLAILWRTLVFVLLFVAIVAISVSFAVLGHAFVAGLLFLPIVLIPWLMRWYTCWMISQIAVRAEA
jgi:hypothetical protein